MKCHPGEVKFQSVRMLLPLDESIARFPGPLKKGKKKDVLTWLKSRIAALEGEYQSTSMNGFTGAEHQKRMEERLLLWRIMDCLVEHDGVLEGTPTVQQAVRNILATSIPEPTSAGAGPTVNPDPIDPAAIAQMRAHLSNGQREQAVWHAVDQRLWAHALLISSTLDRNIWKQVVQEFVRLEVKKVGGDNEALATLYHIFAGNWEESVDELVPASARAGLQMVSTTETVSARKDAMAGLDKWRETLLLVLNNRSAEDVRALAKLGELLAGYGRIEAAHVCFVFARSVSFFGGAEDPTAQITLVGCNHKQQAAELGKDMEAVCLSEVYEFALAMTPQSTFTCAPHLQAYKLQHALVLAEHGFKSEAQAYCNAIGALVTAKASRSVPYYNTNLLTTLDNLSKRLSQTPSDKASGYFSRPSIDKVSSSVWSKFNNFVAGDNEGDHASSGSGPTGSEVGPFAKVSGNTPPSTRPPSQPDIYSSFANGGAVVSTSNSTYAPGSAGSAYAPRRSQEQARPQYMSTSSQGTSPYQSSRPSMEQERPSYMPAPSQSYQSTPSPYAPLQMEATQSSGSPYQPMEEQGISQPIASIEEETPTLEQPASYGYQLSAPSSEPEVPQQPSSYGAYNSPISSYQTEPEVADSDERPPSSYEPPTFAYEPPTSSYEPPVSSYEPPSYTPYESDPNPEKDDSSSQPKPKKKAFNDDDEDDDAAFLARAAALKAESAKNLPPPGPSRTASGHDDAFLAAAEADAARDRERKSSASGASGDKKGWFGGWFGGKKDPNGGGGLGQQPPGPIEAKLGEKSSFYYDTELKKWVNKKDPKSAAAGPTATPPPPRAGPLGRASSAPGGPPAGMGAGGAAPPPPTMRSSSGLGQNVMAMGSTSDLASPPPSLGRTPSATSLPPRSGAATPDSVVGLGLAPSMPAGVSHPLARSVAGAGEGPSSGPPSRPGTALSQASSIDDLLGGPAPRKGGTVKKGKKGGRYVDIMAGR